MKKKWFVPSIFLLVLIVIFLFWLPKQRKTSQSNELVETQEKGYFFPIEITKFNARKAPCLTVEIEEKTISVMLDLGFQGVIEVSSPILDEIKDKTFISSGQKYGVQGKPYPRNFYKIPKMKIGKLSFFDFILEDENEEMKKDSVFVSNGDEPSKHEEGTVGWQVFYQTNVFMDLGNSRIAFCDSLDTLGKEGYSLDSFVKAPLLLDRGLLECEGISADKPIRFFLDSGCTWNIFNTPSERPLDELIWDANSVSESSLQIGEKDFGSTTFLLLPIKLPIHIDAVLGMEFLSSHIVFIDFKNEQIYFAPSVKEELELKTGS